MPHIMQSCSPHHASTIEWSLSHQMSHSQHSNHQVWRALTGQASWIGLWGQEDKVERGSPWLWSPEHVKEVHMDKACSLQPQLTGLWWLLLWELNGAFCLLSLRSSVPPYPLSFNVTVFLYELPCSLLMSSRRNPYSGSSFLEDHCFRGWALV